MTLQDRIYHAAFHEGEEIIVQSVIVMPNERKNEKPMGPSAAGHLSGQPTEGDRPGLRCRQTRRSSRDLVHANIAGPTIYAPVCPGARVAAEAQPVVIVPAGI